jgi:putative DNA primase/helicase
MADKTPQPEKNMAVATKFVNEKNIIIFKQAAYFYHEGIWREESWENTQSWIFKQYLEMHSMPPPNHIVREIMKMIEALTYDKYRLNIKYKLSDYEANEICLKSGILDLDTMKTRKYTKAEFKFSKLNFDFKEKYEAPLFFKFLNTSMGFGVEPDFSTGELAEIYKKTMNFIQEWVGYSLIVGNPFEKALILTSKGRNGKGVLMHIWSTILGKNNCSSLSLAALNDEKHIEATKNKIINFSYDSTKGGQLDTETIKSAISGEPVQASTKYKANFSFNFTAKLVIACNDLPFTSNTDANVKDRFHILPFDVEFSERERDPQLKYKLEAEAEDIFSWAIEGLKRLRGRKYFELPDKCKEAMGEYLTENDTLSQWFDDVDLIDKGRMAKRAEIWTSYRDWVRDGGMKPYGRSKFFKRLRQKGFRETRVTGGDFYIVGLKPPENSPDLNEGNTISFIDKENLDKKNLPF